MGYVPTPEEMTKALDHVFYETWQLTVLTERGSTETVLNNAIVESRLIHVRNLLDFFEHSPSPRDDVLCTHYGFGASIIPVEKQYRDKLNKDVTHLTYSRTKRSEADKEWPPAQAILPVLRRCRSFAEYVLETGTSYGSKTRKEQWEALLADLAKITRVG